MNQDRMEWVKLEQHGTVPSPRDGHCAAYDDVRKQLIIFGGRDAQKRRMNDLYVLDCKTITWKRPTMDGGIPAHREHA
eukprot:5156568-Pyramimonas_sp.AAC.1